MNVIYITSSFIIYKAVLKMLWNQTLKSSCFPGAHAKINEVKMIIYCTAVIF